MKLVNARVKVFKSIDDSGSVSIDPRVTILVGQNESGKTAFLQALHKASSVESGIQYNVTEDYPRKNLTDYENEHEENPAVVCELEYALMDTEIQRINDDLGFELLQNLNFSVDHKYDGTRTISIVVNEKAYVDHLLNTASLTSEIRRALQQSANIEGVIKNLEQLDLNGEETEFLNSIKPRFEKPKNWSVTLGHYIWKNHLNSNIPKFLYFDDYRLLPGKVNLIELKRRVDASKNDPKVLKDEDKTSLSLLKMAKVDLDDLTSATGYEKVKAKLEAISNSITDKVFEYWKQNQDLDVEFDIRQDPADEPPYNNGNNLYIRIKNRRHRVSVPFNQRSKGFIWFFSFIVWFDSIKDQLKTNKDIILLLDEPGLSLHALAQADFLDYIDNLANNHQIIYTTHSPFMVPNEQLTQVRMVEDKKKEGTKITSNISSSDPKTVFPLQAALGYTIAQNLFISKKNLLVEGPADLIYIRFFSSLLESQGKTFLNPEITIIPVGGLDKLATFVALLGGNDLKLTVLHDYNAKPDARLESLIHDKLINKKQVLHYAMFRDAQKSRGNSPTYLSSDVEDMLSPKIYLNLFNGTYQKELSGLAIKETDLPPSDRIVDRINRYLKTNAIALRQSGGYNHYLVANYLASRPIAPSKVDAKTISGFEALFEKVNELLID